MAVKRLEPDRIDCPGLSDGFRQILQFCCGPEVELLRVAALVQGVSFQLFDGHSV